MEIGCGYGHWVATANALLSQKLPVAPRRFLAVDVARHLQVLVADMGRTNGIPDGALSFAAAFVTPNSSKAFSKAEADQATYYDRKWRVSNRSEPVAAAPPLTLHELFRQERLPCIVDLVDMDVQGGEYTILSDAQVLDSMTRFVKRVHIGTHPDKKGVRDESQDSPLINEFRLRNWRVEWWWRQDMHRPQPTPWGPIVFADGVLSFVNENPLKKHTECPWYSGELD